MDNIHLCEDGHELYMHWSQLLDQSKPKAASGHLMAALRPLLGEEKMIDIEKLKTDFAEGRAVNPRNVKALIEEVERLQYEVEDRQGVVDAGKVIVSQLRARAEAAEAKVRELEAAQEWIPIATGRLPEKGQECEVVDPAGYIHNWVHTDQLLNIFAKYTHWRPLTLPQPPKPEEGVEG